MIDAASRARSWFFAAPIHRSGGLVLALSLLIRPTISVAVNLKPAPDAADAVEVCATDLAFPLRHVADAFEGPECAVQIELPNNFATEGAQLFKGELKPCITMLEAALGQVPHDEVGLRLHGIEALRPLLEPGGCIGAVATFALGMMAKPVRAILFNKSEEANWSLAWHQDRTICVKEKREAPGFGPWTLKRGMHHVAPPFDLLTRMVTLRAHLDDVPANNAPLLIAPGSHTLGRITVDRIDEIVRRCGTKICLAEAGDVWLYATPILHASEAASARTGRRVLQVDFAAEALPYGLEWLGV